MKRRLLFVCHSAALGGAEHVLLTLAAHFKDSARVALFQDGPLRGRLEAVGAGVAVLPAGQGVMSVRKQWGLLRSLMAVPAAWRAAVELARLAAGFDVVYATSQKAFVVGAAAAAIAGKPLIWGLNDLLTAEHFSGFHRRLGPLLANLRCERVVVNSEATAEALKACGGRADRIVVVHPGVETAAFSAPDAEAVARLRGEFGLGSLPVVGVFSRLAPWKGQHVLIEALARAPGWGAVVVGEALFGEDEKRYARGLAELARAKSVDGRVKFLGFREDIGALMGACDVIAHTSVAAEPFGLVIVQGMLAGKPVVAARAGGVGEIVADGVDGLLVPPGDAEALASALDRLARDPALSKSLGERARASAARRFSAAAMVEKIERIVSGAGASA